MTAKMIAARKDIPDEHKWDLAALFETGEAWEQLFVQVEKDLRHYETYRGRLKDGVRLFKAAVLVFAHKFYGISHGRVRGLECAGCEFQGTLCAPHQT